MTENIDKDFRNMNKEKVKTKIYLIQNIDQENDDNDDYHDADNLNYFDSDYNNEKNDIETTVSFAMISKITCRRCKLTLKSNNALHKHLRTCIVNTNSVVLHIISKRFLSITIRCLNVDVVGVWDMCPRELMVDRRNKREQIAPKDREKSLCI